MSPGTDWRLESSQDTLDAGAELLSAISPPVLTRPVGERIILDPVEVSFNRRQFDITTLINEAGPDFGDAEITQYLAESGQIGQVAIDYTVPNRTITIPLALRGIPGISFEKARTWLQQKVGLWQRYGGFIKRSTTLGDVYAEVVNATLKLGGSGAQALFDVDADAVLTLVTQPDWFGDEISLGVNGFVGDGTLITDPIEGDYPARTRIIVTDTSGYPQLGMLVAVQSYNYSADAGAAIRYDAASMTVLAGATVQTLAGSNTGNVIKTSVPNTPDPYNPVWQDVLSTQNATSHTDLTHAGTYRVWVRAYSAHPSGATTPSVSLRFSWDVGDLILGSANDAAPISLYDQFVMVDLGEIRLDRAPVGDHRWQGKIQAMSLHSGSYVETVSIDRIVFMPVDEGSTILRATNPGGPYRGVWASGTAYVLNDVVAGSNGNFYVALQPSTGQNPVTDASHTYWSSTLDAVIYGNGVAEARSDGCWRQSSTGTSYGPVSDVTSDLIRLPPSGMEDVPSKIFIKVTRGRLDGQLPDSNIDSFNAEVRYRPSYLFTPGQ